MCKVKNCRNDEHKGAHYGGLCTPCFKYLHFHFLKRKQDHRTKYTIGVLAELKNNADDYLSDYEVAKVEARKVIKGDK